MPQDTERYVLICDLARFIGRATDTLKNHIRKQGIGIIEVRSHRGQLADAITADDAKRVIALETPAISIVNPKDL
jgi:hypothetical protein